MPVLELTTLIPGRTPEQVLDFCLEGVNFPKIFPERARNSSMISWITCEGKPSSLLAPFVRSRSCRFVAHFGPRRAERSLISLQ